MHRLMKARKIENAFESQGEDPTTAIDMKLALIEYVRESPILWDHSHVHFYRSEVSNRLWEDISKALSAEFGTIIKGVELKGIYKNLRDYYRVNCKKVLKEGTEALKAKSRWPYWDALQFLSTLPEKDQETEVSRNEEIDQVNHQSQDLYSARGQRNSITAKRGVSLTNRQILENAYTNVEAIAEKRCSQSSSESFNQKTNKRKWSSAFQGNHPSSGHSSKIEYKLAFIQMVKKNKELWNRHDPNHQKFNLIQKKWNQISLELEERFGTRISGSELKILFKNMKDYMIANRKKFKTEILEWGKAKWMYTEYLLFLLDKDEQDEFRSILDQASTNSEINFEMDKMTEIDQIQSPDQLNVLDILQNGQNIDIKSNMDEMDREDQLESINISKSMNIKKKAICEECGNSYEKLENHLDRCMNCKIESIGRPRDELIVPKVEEDRDGMDILDFLSPPSTSSSISSINISNPIFIKLKEFLKLIPSIIKKVEELENRIASNQEDKIIESINCGNCVKMFSIEELFSCIECQLNICGNCGLRRHRHHELIDLSIEKGKRVYEEIKNEMNCQFGEKIDLISKDSQEVISNSRLIQEEISSKIESILKAESFDEKKRISDECRRFADRFRVISKKYGEHLRSYKTEIEELLVKIKEVIE